MPTQSARFRHCLRATLVLSVWLAACSNPKSGATVQPGFSLPETSQVKKDVIDTEQGTDLPDAETATDDTDAEEPADVEAADTTPDVGYQGTYCTSNGACKDTPETPFCLTNLHQCVQCLFDASPGVTPQCPTGSKCIDHKCEVFACQPGTQVCHDFNSFDVCAADGKSVTVSGCPDNKPVCVQDACHVCMPDKVYCGKPPAGTAESKTLLKCNTTGTKATVQETCAGGKLCINGKCQVCQAGVKLCDGDKAMACQSDGGGYELSQDCGKKGWQCTGGLCKDPCSFDPKSKTNVGCDYYAVDLDNAYVFSGTSNPDGTPKYFDAQNSQFSVIVSNTAQKPAVVTVTAGTGQKSSYTVPPGALKIINLPDPLWKVQKPGQQNPLNQDGTNRNRSAYRIQSNQPIVAYQFNPLQNYDVFSNDASLLLPMNGLDTEYWVMTREQTGQLRGYLTVVAPATGKTHVKVTTTAPTQSGVCYSVPDPSFPSDPTKNIKWPTSCNNAVVAMKKGDSQEFDLAQGEVLNIETDAVGGDLTGTHVTADKPIAVFGGSESSNSPNTDHCVAGKCEYQGWECTTNDDCPRTCCQDHMEEQLFPVSSWGVSYLATKLQVRGKEKDAWRILASEDGTIVTTNPVVAAIPPLSQGQWFEFESDKDFALTSNKPIMLGQFMAGSFAPDPNMDSCTTKFSSQSEKICTTTWNTSGEPVACKKSSDCPNMFQEGDAKIGDPDFSLSVPTDQYLSSYVFLAPTKYVQNYINVMLPVGGSATLDKKPLNPASFAPFTAGWLIGRFPITEGAHTLECPTKNKSNCGLVVYGWAPFVSYSYPGGVALK